VSRAVGWTGRDRDDTEVVALRAHLEAHNGLLGLEITTPHEVDRATRLFRRDGFVVVADALDADQLAFLRGGVERVVADILAVDPGRAGNRGSHRYSFGAASTTGNQLHHPEWRMLIDLPTVTPILTSIFGSSDYMLRGGGGDFCLPGAVEYQPLHADMGDRVEYEGRTFGSFHDPRGRISVRDLPVPYIACNFLVTDFTRLNGPTRQIPGTQHSREPITKLKYEPEWMKLSTVCPAPAGAVLLRDVRAWHGGTPNLSDEVRAMPNVEFFAPWYRERVDISMSRADYETLSAHGRRIARYSTADSADPFAPETILGWTPPGSDSTPDAPRARTRREEPVQSGENSSA
jgi:Phytanoyl-CoA dioxygenase (PhyH)